MSDDVDDVIKDLVLAHERGERVYDPVKRKEYYERTKKLKGRAGQNLPERQGNPNVRTAPNLDSQLKKAEAKRKKARENLKRVKSLDSKLKRAENAAKKIPFEGARKKALAKIRQQRAKLENKAANATARRQAADNTARELGSAKAAESARAQREAKKDAARRKEQARRKNSLGTKLGRHAKSLEKAYKKVEGFPAEQRRRDEERLNKMTKKLKDAAELKSIRAKARKAGAKDVAKAKRIANNLKRDFESARG